MRYVGNLVESEAKAYKDREYTHTEHIKGRDVRFYDCWSHSDELPPAFGENLNKQKINWLDQIFRQQKDSEDLIQ